VGQVTSNGESQLTVFIKWFKQIEAIIFHYQVELTRLSKLRTEQIDVSLSIRSVEADGALVQSLRIGAIIRENQVDMEQCRKNLDSDRSNVLDLLIDEVGVREVELEVDF